MDAETRERLRQTFEEVPDLYERVRPTYPTELFDDAVALAGLGPGARVLEVGCGTGQATVPLARRGLTLVCVEFGERLADAARRALAPFPDVEVVCAPFETWHAAPRSFDAVVAFASFHWLDPEARCSKPASLLRPGGSLIVGDWRDVRLPDGDGFFDEMVGDYEAVLGHGDPLALPEEVGSFADEIEASGWYDDLIVRRYLWTQAYSADDYVSFLETRASHRALAPEVRAALHDRIRRRIVSRAGGSVDAAFVATLHSARTG